MAAMKTPRIIVQMVAALNAANEMEAKAARARRSQKPRPRVRDECSTPSYVVKPSNDPSHWGV